jgi:hypothetical protein
MNKKLFMMVILVGILFLVGCARQCVEETMFINHVIKKGNETCIFATNEGELTFHGETCKKQQDDLLLRNSCNEEGWK